MADDTFDFGLGSITKVLTEQTSRLLNRQDEQRANQTQVEQAAKEKAKLAKKSLEVNQSLFEDMTPLLDGVKKTSSAREEMEALRASGDIGSFLQAEGNKILNPGLYTTKGRNKTLAELSNEMNVRSTVAAQQQQVLAGAETLVDANLRASQAGLNMAILAEQQGAERIQAEVARVQTQLQVIATNQSIQSSILDGMDTTQIKAAAAKAGGKPIDINGVMISPGALEKRVLDMEAIEEIRENRALVQENRKFELDKKLSRRELQLMSTTQLRDILSNGDPTGQFAIEDVEQIYGIKSSAEAAQITRLQQEFQFADFGANTIVPAAETIQRMRESVPKGTPLEAELNNYQRVTSSIAQSAEAFREKGGIPIELAVAGDAAIKAQEEKLNKAIEQQATLQSKGDKDMKDILIESYKGNPVPRDSVENAITTRLLKDRSLEDVLPAKVAGRVKEVYLQTYQDLQTQNAYGAMDKETMRRQATQAAIQVAVSEDITSRSTDFLANQLEMPDNPINGKLTKTQVIDMAAEASRKGMAAFQESNGLTFEEMSKVVNGEAIPSKGINEASLVDLELAQRVEFFFQLDSIEAGLSKKYTEWWQTQGGKYIGAVQQKRVEQANKGGVTTQAMEAYAGPIEVEGSQNYIRTLETARDLYTGKKEERYHNLVSFDQKPEYRQAALLQFDSSLNDGERKTFMKSFVLPIIKQAQEKRLDFDETNILIERAIDAGNHEDPQVNKVLKKVTANRPQTVDSLESILQKPFGFQLEKNGPRMGFSSSVWLRNTVNRRKYDWFEEVMKGQ